METISDEVMIEILSYLDVRDLCRVSTVNKDLYYLASSNFLWKNVFIRRWETNPLAKNQIKKSYAELNQGVNSLIRKHQEETLRLQDMLLQEKQRQFENLARRLEEKRKKRCFELAYSMNSDQ